MKFNVSLYFSSFVEYLGFLFYDFLEASLKLVCYIFFCYNINCLDAAACFFGCKRGQIM